MVSFFLKKIPFQSSINFGKSTQMKSVIIVLQNLMKINTNLDVQTKL